MTYFNDPQIPRFQEPDSFDDGNWCDHCDAVIETDDMFETACSCNPEEFCSECGEELPDEEDAHCENCFEADSQ